MPAENRLFEDIARVASGALGAAAGLRDEVEAMVRQRVERIAADLNLVSREEYEAALELAQRARAEQEALTAELGTLKAAGEQRHAELELRLAALEAKLAAGAPAAKSSGAAAPGTGGE